MMTSEALSSVVLVGNGVWMMASLLFAVGCHLVLSTHGPQLSPPTREIVCWARVPSICVFLHRLFWNSAIVLSPDAVSFHPRFLQFQWVTLVITVVITYGLYRSVRPIFGPRRRRRLLLAFTLGCAASGGFWWWIA